jgi:TIR domain
MATSSQHPTVFISYSWSSAEHEDFVIALATRLRENSVDARLDKWDLKEGQDKYAFMESMVTDATISKVLVICDAKYVAKSNSRAGGVGTETQIISAEIYGKVKQDKFLPVVVELDEQGKACLPTFMASRIYIDMSSEEAYADGFDQLLRAIYDKPRYQRPALGKPPVFDEGDAVAGPSRELMAYRRALEEGKRSADGLEAQFVKAMLVELPKLLDTKTSPNIDEIVVSAIERSRHCRDLFDAFVVLKTSFTQDDPARYKRLLNLLEGLFVLCEAPEGTDNYAPHWFDVFRFLSWEFILLVTAAMIRECAWVSLDALCSEGFVVHRSGADRLLGFASFDGPLKVLDQDRNQRLQLRRVSVSADMLHARSAKDGVRFQELMQADMFLSLRSLLHAKTTVHGGYTWFPYTLCYGRRDEAFPLFMKARSDSTRRGLHKALGVHNGADFTVRYEQAAKLFKNFEGWRLDGRQINLGVLANLEALAA